MTKSSEHPSPQCPKHEILMKKIPGDRLWWCEECLDAYSAYSIRGVGIVLPAPPGKMQEMDLTKVDPGVL